MQIFGQTRAAHSPGGAAGAPPLQLPRFSRSPQAPSGCWFTRRPLTYNILKAQSIDSLCEQQQLHTQKNYE